MPVLFRQQSTTVDAKVIGKSSRNPCTSVDSGAWSGRVVASISFCATRLCVPSTSRMPTLHTTQLGSINIVLEKRFGDWI